MRGARTLAIAAAACAAVPAIAGGAVRERSIYAISSASGTEKVTFTADANTCLHFNTCARSGAISYKFAGAPRGKLVLQLDRSGRIAGMASFTTRGTTMANVTAGTLCTDTVRHRRESFKLRSPSKTGRLIFALHGDKTDYLATQCAGPTEDTLATAHALPQTRYKRTEFNHASTTFGLTGSSFFSQRGYRGKVTWKLAYKVTRLACSPHCRAVSTAR